MRLYIVRLFGQHCGYAGRNAVFVDGFDGEIIGPVFVHAFEIVVVGYIPRVSWVGSWVKVVGFICHLAQTNSWWGG